MSDIQKQTGGEETPEKPTLPSLAFILSPAFLEACRKAQAKALDDIPDERVGIGACVGEAHNAFFYEDPWVMLTVRPAGAHYELEFTSFRKASTTKELTPLPKITNPIEALGALELEVRDYWTAPMHMQPNAPSNILELFAEVKSRYRKST